MHVFVALNVRNIPPFVIHDLMRTVRTNLSGLAIPNDVREMMTAHVQKGMNAVYNRYDYLPEKTRGFHLWNDALRGILAVLDDDDNVVALHKN